MNQKIIIDMDIGDDIDDAFALLLAMHSGMDIIGITTVFKNTEERARIAKLIMKKYGKGYENVPVYAGYGTPLAENNEKYPHTCQYTEDLSSDDLKPNSADPEDAVDFIIESCKKYKEQLTIIPIGPFTNIAKVIQKDKNALSLAGKIVIMGGAYFKQYVDWNVICDVEAAKIMFENLENIRCIGADVTHQLRLDAEDDKKICSYTGNAATEYVKTLYKLWKKNTNSIGILHDPLAVYYAIDESICTCQSSSVVLIDTGLARGITLNVNAYGKHYLNTAYAGFDFSKQHLLAQTVDRERMIRTFIKCFEE
jgi:purine nucleosidase/pyrimidine-specific ribonucleoside hydrolase